MAAHRSTGHVAVLLTAVLVAGCQWVPQSRYDASQAQLRALAEQSRAQQAELANLRAHSRQIESQLLRAEEDLALLEEEGAGKRYASYEGRRANLYDALGNSTGTELRRQLLSVAERAPNLEFELQGGLLRSQAELLFETGQADLDADSRRLLSELARAFQAGDAGELRVLIIGHTDDRPVAKKPTRELFPDNWHLSTARALAVAAYLREAGLPEERLGVAGFADAQPVAESRTPEGRQRNRRVEILVVGSEAPLVGSNRRERSYR